MEGVQRRGEPDAREAGVVQSHQQDEAGHGAQPTGRGRRAHVDGGGCLRTRQNARDDQPMPSIETAMPQNTVAITPQRITSSSYFDASPVGAASPRLTRT